MNDDDKFGAGTRTTIHARAGGDQRTRDDENPRSPIAMLSLNHLSTLLAARRRLLRAIARAILRMYAIYMPARLHLHLLHPGFMLFFSPDARQHIHLFFGCRKS